MVVERAEEAAHHPDQQEQWQLPQVVGRVVELPKVEEATVAELTGVASEDGEQHVQGKVARHRTEEYSPGKGLVPEGGALLQAEQDAADWSPESGGNPSGRAPRHKVPLLLVLTEEGKGFCVDLEGCRFALRYTSL